MRFTKEQLEDLYINQSLSQIEIGKMFEVDRKLIDYYMKKHGIPKRDQREAGFLKNAQIRGYSIEIDEVLKMIELGMLVNEIAEHFGVTRVVIANQLKAHGYNMHNNENQRKRQSVMMLANNPVPKGSKREAEVTKAMHDANKRDFETKKSNVSTFGEYARIARYIAYAHFGKGNDVPEGLEVDHMYSIADGFANNVPLDVISHHFNLRLITVAENRSKAGKSIISLDDLYKGVGVQRLSKPEKGVE